MHINTHILKAVSSLLIPVQHHRAYSHCPSFLICNSFFDREKSGLHYLPRIHFFTQSKYTYKELSEFLTPIPVSKTNVLMLKKQEIRDTIKDGKADFI